jgi:hypothetical protein
MYRALAPVEITRKTLGIQLAELEKYEITRLNEIELLA